MLLQKSAFRGLGDLGDLGDWGIWRIASPKHDVVQLLDYLNTALSKCGVVVVLTLVLALSLV